MTIKQKIQSLLSAANETTGESDTDLTSAVSTLIDGYGGGDSKKTCIVNLNSNDQVIDILTYGFFSRIDDQTTFISANLYNEKVSERFDTALCDSLMAVVVCGESSYQVYVSGGIELLATYKNNVRNSIFFFRTPTEETTSTIVFAKTSYENLIPLSIDDDLAIYNFGLGYKNGYRLNSSFGETSDANCTVTGYIPFDKTKTLRVNGTPFMPLPGDGYAYFEAFSALPASGAVTKAWCNVGSSGYNFGSFIKFKDNNAVRDADGSFVLWDGNNENGGNQWLELVGGGESILNEIKFIRLSFLGSGEDAIVTLNQRITDENV